MTRHAWVTPDTTGDSNIARCLSVPYNLQPMVNYQLDQLRFEENWEQVGDLTPADCAAEFDNILSAYFESVCDMPQEYPEHLDIFWHNGNVIAGNPLAFSSMSGMYTGGVWRQSPGAINDEASWNVFLRSGTYDMEILSRTGNDSGRLTWYVDGDAQSGYAEFYSPTGTNNVRIVREIVIPDSGLHVLRSISASKHASSVGYNAYASLIHLRRTGA